jgi:transcription initiation factor TFIIA large subunit
MAQLKGQGKEKEPAASVTNVYLHVVEDVIQNVRDEFQSEGVDESVLVELRQLWELKMMQAGAIQGASFQETVAPVPSKAGVTLTPVHDLNVPYEATDEYQTPTVDLLFPPTPQAMTPIVTTPLPMTPQADVISSQTDTTSPALTGTGEPIVFQYMPPGPSESVAGGDGGLDIDSKLGRPASFMVPLCHSRFYRL